MCHGPLALRVIFVFRSAIPHSRAAYQFRCQLLLSERPPPGHTALAPVQLAIARPAHSPRHAASRCIAKRLEESLAPASRGCPICLRLLFRAPPDTAGTAS